MIYIRSRSLKKEEKDSVSQDIPLSKKLEDNLNFFSALYKDSPDVVFCSFIAGKNEVAVIYIEGLSDTQKLEDQVLETLLNEKEFDETNMLLSIKHRLPIANIDKVSTYVACVEAIAGGNPFCF